MIGMKQKITNPICSFYQGKQEGVKLTDNPGIKDVNQTKPALFIHTIDRNDNIVDLNDAWLRFALENNAPHLTYQAIMGHSLWSFIAGPETHHLYRLLLKQIRQSQQRVVFTHRCDSPTLIRYIQMEIVPTANGVVEFRNQLLLQKHRDPIPLLDPTVQRTSELLKMCSWCNRLLCDQTWLLLEEAINYMGLFGSSQLPQITHGICPACILLFADLS